MLYVKSFLFCKKTKKQTNKQKNSTVHGVSRPEFSFLQIELDT